MFALTQEITGCCNQSKLRKVILVFVSCFESVYLDNMWDVLPFLYKLKIDQKIISVEIIPPWFEVNSVSPATLYDLCVQTDR